MSEMKMKRRVLKRTRLKTHVYKIDTTSGWVKNDEDVVLDLLDHQLTWSEGHAWPRDRARRDTGGPFATAKLEYTNFSNAKFRAHDPTAYDQQTYSGDVTPYFWHDGHTPFITEEPGWDMVARWIDGDNGLDQSHLITLGTNYINQTIPTSPVVDGSVALAELFREGLPSMIGSALLKGRADFFRSLGSEYLNVEFGWKPLVADLKNAAKAVQDSYAIMKRLEEYSGRDLKRFRVSPKVSEVVYHVGTQEAPSGIPNQTFWVSTPWVVRTETRTRQSWFSGSYTYYYEPSRMSEIERIVAEARLLYGVKLTPDVLWNLAPWSWLVDWFANVGPVLSNMSAFQNDGLVLRYGYVMEETSRNIRRSLFAEPLNNGWISNTHPKNAQDEFNGTLKRREKATPFGFGLNSSAFTNRQWTILGALGLTRIPKSL